MIHYIETREMHPHMKRLVKFVIKHWPVCFILPLIFQIQVFFYSLLRSVAYSHSGGQVERPEVRVRPLSWTGHRLLFLLWPDAAQTQAETGRWHGGKIMTTAEEHGFMIWAFASFSLSFTTSPLSPGVRPGLPGVCHSVWRHRSLHVSGRQRGLFVIRPRSGHCNQWDLSVLGGTARLPILPYR